MYYVVCGTCYMLRTFAHNSGGMHAGIVLDGAMAMIDQFK